MALTGRTIKGSPEHFHFTMRHSVVHSLQPFGAALVGITLWYLLLWSNEIHIPEADSEMAALTIFVLVTLVYVFVASFIFVEVWQKHERVKTLAMEDALEPKKLEFLKLRDKRTPVIGLLWLGWMSVFTVILMGLLHWHTLFGGSLAVGVASFVVSGVWVLITHLDDCKNDLWIFERIPEDWWTVHIDEVFSLDGVSEHPDPVEQLKRTG